ncbi:hypothetical protein EPYR_03410 [Erwinia pyrifoliae DSM 12163]|nr:hypothetical protein EPYR_01176 [Erwinia pyrifoliae DSM 12163]CAY75781.1 hypothetical protein EPYR_03401 [Erwinia pyrifoliae DSM 12163]CAY75790.1 hypothetical protein EPYR_03410 [Erwinia pyrifoliae DSM 12163]
MGKNGFRPHHAWAERQTGRGGAKSTVPAIKPKSYRQSTSQDVPP